MKKIAIVYSSHKEQISEYLIKVIREFLKYNLEVSVLRSGLIDLIDLKVNYENNLDDLMKNCDLVLILGGDGTIMHFAKLAARYNKYILGVNAGRIGFLSSIEINQIDKIFNIVNGNFNVDRRTMFEVSYGDKSKIILNEVSLNRNLQSRISDYEIYEKEKLVCNYRSDGVIISTPTGSTAYSFSAGGPIAHPNMNCAIITPVCPYSIFSRSLILPGDEKIILKYRSINAGDIVISFDGVSESLNSKSGEICIKRAPIDANFINFENHNFYSIDRKILDKMV